MKKIFNYLFLLISISVIIINCQSKDIQNSGNTGIDSELSKKDSNKEKSMQDNSAPSRTADDKIINWQANIKGILFNWDGKDLIVQQNSQNKLGLFAELSKKSFKLLNREEINRNCYSSYSFRPSSVVDSIISFEYESELSCGAVTSLYWGYGSLDLKRKGEISFPFGDKLKGSDKTIGNKSISLKDLYSEEEVLKALLSNKQISTDISALVNDGKINDFPKTLDELNSLFEEYDYDFFGGYHYLDPNYLKSFTFQSVQDNSLLIFISLTSSSHANQADHDHIEISLPIPNNIKESILLADSTKEGFLQKDARRLTGSGWANFEK